MSNLTLGHSFLIILLVELASSKPGDLSKQKCAEYSKFVYTEEHSPVLHVETRLHSISQCGIVEVPLIIGGVKAAKTEFPHMAVIGFGADAHTNDLAWHCGGTLISETFILTAAHCVTHRDKGDAQRVRIGAISLKTHDTHVQEIKIANRITHPKYQSKSKYNDIALMKLVQAAALNEHVHPACLNTELNAKWNLAVATGFGRLAYEDENGSLNLMKVQLSSIKDHDCQATYKTFRAMTEGVLQSQLCAGEMAGKKDTCQGDSGGPLQIVLDHPYCMYSIIGITSFGKFCGFENSPGIYTRVAYFLDWIEENVWK